MMPGLARSLARTLGRFSANERGMSAVEFALILPLMLMLYVGGIELSQAISADRKTSLISRTVADLVAQVATVTDTDMGNIFDAASEVALPFPASTTINGVTSSALTVTISSIVIDANGKATIAWSDTLVGSTKNMPGTAHNPGDVVTFQPCTNCNDPNVLDVKSTSLIWAEVTYAWTPAVNFAPGKWGGMGGGQKMLNSSFTLKDQIYMRPRVTTCVTRQYASKTLGGC